MRTSAAFIVSVTLFSLSACDKSGVTAGPTSTDPTTAVVPPPIAVVRDSGAAAADRVLARNVISFYRWRATEPGNDSTRGESIEHGIVKLHLIVESRKDAEGHNYVQCALLQGETSIPQSVRMRALNAGSSTYNVAREGFTKYSLENFGGELRANEPVQVALSTSPSARMTLTAASTPNWQRIPTTGEIAGGSAPQIGQVDAVLVFLIPVSSRRGGRVLIHALDMNAEPGGFAANGVMTRSPSDSEITRYVRWMRDRNGMGRDRNPPIAVHPIDRS
jgi:hypothetical protein